MTLSMRVQAVKLICVPIHREEHWGLVAVDRTVQRTTYFDSLGLNGREALKNVVP